MVELESRRKLLGVVAIAAMAAFAAKITLTVNTYGSNDVLFWEGNLAKIRADGGLALYRDGIQMFRQEFHIESFNQPPFTIHLVKLWGWIADHTGLPLRFWIRFSSALADLGSLALVWRILARSPTLKLRLSGMLLVALSPVAIMVSGFHGNTDAIMVFFSLLSIDLLEIGPSWLAGLALGMAINIKIVPVVFAPAVILYLPSMRRRAEFVAGTGIAFLGGSLPFLAQDPMLVMSRVFGYSGHLGHWGFSRLIHVIALTMGPGESLYEAYLRVAKPLTLAAALAAALWMNRRSEKPPLFVQYGWIAFLFLVFSPAFGAQYLSWLVPWVAVLDGWAVWVYWVSSGLFLLELYTYWCRGFPWYLADMIYTADLRGSLLYFSLETVCWATVVWVAWQEGCWMSDLGFWQNRLPQRIQPTSKI